MDGEDRSCPCDVMVLTCDADENSELSHLRMSGYSRLVVAAVYPHNTQHAVPNPQLTISCSTTHSSNTVAMATTDPPPTDIFQGSSVNVAGSDTKSPGGGATTKPLSKSQKDADDMAHDHDIPGSSGSLR